MCSTDIIVCYTEGALKEFVYLEEIWGLLLESKTASIEIP